MNLKNNTNVDHNTYFRFQGLPSEEKARLIDLAKKFQTCLDFPFPHEGMDSSTLPIEDNDKKFIFLIILKNFEL